jgi:hypothetical protein
MARKTPIQQDIEDIEKHSIEAHWTNKDTLELSTLRHVDVDEDTVRQYRPKED